MIYLLTPRLACIQSHITASVIADIGTDHAYLPISLAESGKLKQAIACDIRSGPLSIAQENIQKHGFTNLIETRLGDGLSPLYEGEVHEIIIAGMGALTIMDILKKGGAVARSAERIILQPMDGQAELRRFLRAQHYVIFEEDLAQERDKLYQVLCIRSGNPSMPACELDDIIPPALYGHPFIHMMIDKQRKKWEKIYCGKMSSKSEQADAAHFADLLKQLNKLEEQL